MYLQNKNENLEQENKLLRKENDELQRMRVAKQNDKVRNTLTQTRSQTLLKNKNDHMEMLLKEQIECMKKMLVLVQDKKPVEYSDSDSNLHFEESFNVTNMSSNSNDFHPEFVYNIKLFRNNTNDKEVYDLRNKFSNAVRRVKVEDDLQKIPSQQKSRMKPNSSVHFNITSSSNSVHAKLKKKSGGILLFI
jgi:hypothetical protein